MQEQTYVQGTDNRYYQAPILFGKNWYVSFTTDEPEIIVRRSVKSTRVSILKRMRKYLREHSIIADVVIESITDDRQVFPPKWSGFVESSSGNLILKDQIPIDGKAEVHSRVSLMSKPVEAGTYYTFNDLFDVKDIITVFQGIPNKKVVKWLTGRDDIKIGTLRMARNEVARQRPDIYNTDISAIRLKRHKKFVGAEMVSTWS